jgi:hypothetical protein
MDRSVVAGKLTRQVCSVEVARLNRETLPQAKSRPELETWEDEGGTTHQTLGQGGPPELPGPNETRADDPSLS